MCSWESERQSLPTRRRPEEDLWRLLATTQDDFEAGRFSYNSADYATQTEADAALTAWLDAIVEKVEREAAPIPPRDADDS